MSLPNTFGHLKPDNYRTIIILSCFEAHKSVRKSHDDLKALFPDITLEEVQLWFTKFKRDNMNATMADVGPEMEFSDIYEDAHKAYLTYLGGKDLQNVRLVCKDLNKLVINMDVDYKKVRIRLNLNGIVINTVKRGSLEQHLVSQTEGGCIIKEHKKEAKFSQKTFIEEAMSKFKEIVEKKDCKTENLVIGYDFNGGNNIATLRTEFLGRISSILADLDKQLTCNELEISIHSPAELKSVLENLNSQLLTKLTVRTENADPFDLTEITSLPHWARLVELYTDRGRMILPLDGLIHIPRVNTGIHGMASPEMVVDYVKSFLQFPDALYHMVGISVDADIVMGLLEPYGIQNAGDQGITGRIPLEIGGYLEYFYGSYVLMVRKYTSYKD